jgi:hypothetical protein
MKYPVLALLLSFVLLSAFQCCKEPVQAPTCYKARLEIKGVCMNYTIKVLDSAFDPSLIQASWTDPATGQTYQNVFGLASSCDFPADIAEGDEFYFILNDNPNMTCGVCEAYRPTPSKKLRILAAKAPCN